MSRDPDGRLELFLPGERLVASIKVVSDRLSNHEWSFEDGATLSANRLQFSDAPHFDGVVAFLCAELLENGVRSDLGAAFSATEPAIALALERVAVGTEVLVGLAGELSLLDGLTSRVGPAGCKALVRGWMGSAPSARDFRIGTVGVEVKTTSGTVSKHHVQGLHQVERGHADGGAPETALWLLSLGIRWVEPGEGGTTVPDLVESISRRLDADDRDMFLAMLRQYGGDAGRGYKHERDKFVASYSRPFTMRFERMYDMADPMISLPRRGDLETYSDLDIDSLSFRIDLPMRVHGDINPVTGWSSILGRLVMALDSD
ncbi:PD-(D/E)XK motif protein [Nocardioides marmotae]|uniref:PD-(D/E)XK motif protein n=1 Tax=Nocardioides marmotae TaxID=2663857 RepID=UPI00165936DF|nr:PD-(D/E)XK motif protein [Nocardioides marmotae]MBC9734361.1 PD-(D/E)XK motif protein [Nocardioides marmotae]